jgi:hypothetical protein
LSAITWQPVRDADEAIGQEGDVEAELGRGPVDPLLLRRQQIDEQGGEVGFGQTSDHMGVAGLCRLLPLP